MNFLALLPILSTFIERVFPDKAKQAEAQVALQKAINDAEIEQAKIDADKMESQSKVLVAEASSQSYAARNWRPHLMYGLMIIVVYNYILTPILKVMFNGIPVIPLPNELWTLLSIGLGGYIGKDMIGHYASSKFEAQTSIASFNDEKYFATIRKLFPKGLSQEQVDVLNEAKKEGLNK